MGIIKIILLLIILCPFNSFSANLLYSEDFDDGDIDQPAIGSMTVYYDFSYTEAVVPDDYNISTTGRGGTGYCFSGVQNVSAWILWNYGQSWPTDEMYVSFWQRFQNYTYTDPNENFKLFYPHWGNSYFVALVYSASTTQYKVNNNEDEFPLLSPDSRYVTTQNQLDGNWHHHEIWLKFSTGQVKAWYDSQLVVDATLSSGTWDRFDGYLTLGSEDSEEPGIFLRQYDDWEVWDGIPTASQNNSHFSPGIGGVIKRQAGGYYIPASN